MDNKELRAKSIEQLKQLVLDLKKEAFNLRFQAVSGELANTARVRTVRRTLARVHTLIKEKVAGGSNA